MTSPILHRSRTTRGYVLIAAIVFLLVLTFLGVTMYHSFNAQENMAANSKEKSRAFQVAQSSLQYAEYLLAQNTTFVQGGTCATTTPLTTPTICSDAVNVIPATFTSPMTLGNGMPYTTMEPALNVVPGAGQANTYYANPQIYIQYLGISPDNQGQLYQITALGYGATGNAVAVVQSTFETSSGVKNLGGL
ncbi:PilX N-terminal domain-containing pilus assembly protein [Dyella sp. C9]|uniref:pilus assembly PilX family protein n=1 Tax=Dyella sp. C9 TaxID=2202154 RepID=UPI001300A317|nr:PilX N-terminal domain-containing pilus assembly protein [Dyella sp. C9]